MDLSVRWEQLDREAYEIPHDPARLPAREPLLIERLRIARTFGLDDPRLEQSHGNLLHYYYCDVADYAKVEPVCRYWITLKQDQLTASQHDLHVLYELGTSLSMQDRYVESEAQYRRALQLAESDFGPDHNVTQGSIFQLAQFLKNRKQYADALELCERLLALREDGSASIPMQSIPYFVRECYVALGRFADAEAVLRTEVAQRSQREPEGSDHIAAMTLSELSDVVAKQGRLDEALTLKHEAVTRMTAAFDAMSARHERFRADAEQRGLKTFGPLRREIERYARRSYAALLGRANRLDEAEAIYRDELAMQEAEAQQPSVSTYDPPALGRALHVATAAEVRSAILKGLVEVLRAGGRHDEAEPMAAEADSLASDAANLRDRTNRIGRKRFQRDPRRQSELTVDDVRRLLESSV